MSKLHRQGKKKNIVIALLCLLILILSMIVLYINSVYMPLDHAKLNNIHPTVNILDNNGDSIDQSLYIGSSKYVNIDNLQQHTLDAFVCVEDKRFWQHNGIDCTRIIGATVSNIKSGSFKEGASTISQQLIKNTHLDNGKTLRRKISEQLLAIQLEQQYSKHEILEMYLNTIYFGCNAYGIENASLAYFGIDAAELDIAQSACLAGMIKAPNNYNPLTNTDKCIARRNVVLNIMLDQDTIDKVQYDSAIESDIECIADTTNSYTYLYGVIEQACDILNMTPTQLANSCLTIHTYYDKVAQQQLEQSITEQYTHQNTGDSCMGLMCNNNNSGITAMYTVGDYRGNNARQVGSTIKPIAVYAPAIDMGQLTSASLILDERTSFSQYNPSNYNNSYHGWVTATDALAQSMNVPSVKILNGLGVENSCKYLNSMGVEADNQDLSLALGNVSSGMNIVQLAQCYTTIANNGVYNRASFISSIENNNGNIYSNYLCNQQVFAPSTAYITTNMLQYATKSGTAKRLQNLDYDIACKTGTVGNSFGNTDAISCAYTSQNTMVCWLSGQLDNSITGGTLPTQIIADTLSDYYTNNAPNNFVVPSDVEMVAIDMHEITSNQKVLVAGTHTKSSQCRLFPFANNNKPTEHSKLMQLPTLDISIVDNSVHIHCNTNNTVNIMRACGDQTICVGQGNDIIDYQIEAGQQYTYYAQIMCCDKIVAQSANYTVNLPQQMLDDNNTIMPDISLPQSNTDDTVQLPDSTDKKLNILDILYIGNRK